ncbi:hypothetical protein D3C86_1869420 [compost metagenome]
MIAWLWAGSVEVRLKKERRPLGEVTVIGAIARSFQSKPIPAPPLALKARRPTTR